MARASEPLASLHGLAASAVMVVILKTVFANLPASREIVEPPRPIEKRLHPELQGKKSVDLQAVVRST